MAKKLHYDFANDLSLVAKVGPTLSLTRATEASVMDYNNVLKTVQSGEARFTGGRRVENLAIQSQTFNHASWSEISNALAVVGDEAVAPDGTTTADLLIDDSSTGTGFVGMSISQTFGSLQGSHTYSCYMKANGEDWGYLDITGIGALTLKASFDLTNGVVGATVGAGNDAEGIEDAGNGWYRCWISFTTTTDVSGALRIFVADGNNDITVALDGTSSIFIWGAQVEDVSGQDDPSPSEYQATTTAAVSKWYATKRRTNLLTHSNDFSGTGWTNARSIDTQDVGTDPFGGNAAQRVVDSAGGGSNSAYVYKAVQLRQGSYVASVYAKADGVDHMALQTLGFNSVANGISYANLATGTLGTGSANHEESIEDIGNGWYRYSIKFLVLASDDLGQINIYTCQADGTPSSDMDGTTSTLFYGAQVERGSSATDYIATTAAVASSGFDTSITPTGLLVEEARTNICLQSESFEEAEWTTAANSTFTKTQTAPDGTSTGTDVIHNDNNELNVQNIVVVADTVYTYSVYIKQGITGAHDWVRIAYYNGGNGMQAWFDLTNAAAAGTPATFGAGITLTGTSVEDVGNGWYRVSLTGQLASGVTAAVIEIENVTADSGTTSEQAASVIWWGAQLEAGAFVGSYIPTVAASVTRNLDLVNVILASEFDETLGTLYVEFNKLKGSEAEQGYGAHISTGAANYISSYCVGNDAVGRVWAGGVAQLNVTTGNNEFTDSAFVKTTVAWGDDAAHYAEGVQGGTSGSITSPNPGTYTLDVGRDHNGPELNGHITEIRYYDERLDNATLEDLSNGIFPPEGGSAAGIGLGFGKIGMR